MLKKILEDKKITAYRLSKDTGIPYSTISDLVLENTQIEKTNSATLYRLAKYLDYTMEELYEGKLKNTEE